MSILTPTNQTISINNSDGRIFDFNTPSSRVYLGETINSLLKPFGKSCVLTGFDITAEYKSSILHTPTDGTLGTWIEPCDIVKVELNPGEAVIDTTFITYLEKNTIELDVSGYDENNGFLILSIMFNHIGIMQKNFSKLMLSYVTNDGNVPNRVWYNDCENIILHKLYFNKINKTVRVKANDIVTRHKVTIEGKSYDIYPLDNISKRISLMLNSYFG